MELKRIVLGIAAFLTLASGSAFAADSAQSTGQKLDRIMALIQTGKPAEAVKLADEVIAEAGKKAADKDTEYFCASDGPNMLIEMMTRMAAQEKGGAKKNIVAVSNDICLAHFYKGFALIDLGRGDLAEPELRAAMELAPREAHYANEYAELFKSRREWQKSYDLFARAWSVVDKTKGGPNSAIAARALRGMGFNKIELSDLDEAERLFRQSLEFEPGNTGALNELEYIARKKAIGS